MNKTIVGTAVIALVMGLGVGYEGASLLHPATATLNGRGNFPGVNGGPTGARTSGTAGMLSGTVAAKDSGSITVNTRDGSSHVVLITPATTVSKSVNGALTDVATGSTVIVTGTTNGDGSVSASVIQLRPTPPTAQ